MPTLYKTRTFENGNHLSQVRLKFFYSSDTLGFNNGALSVKAYSGNIKDPFGSQLPSPFNPCVWHRLTPYPALWASLGAY